MHKYNLLIVISILFSMKNDKANDIYFFLDCYEEIINQEITDNDIIAAKKYAKHFALLDVNYDKSLIKINKYLEKQKHSFVFFIEDHKGNEYIVKQDRSSTLKHQFQVVLEKLAAYMADKIGVSTQKVEIIAADVDFPGKLILERPASIHTKMPGITIRELKSGPYQNLYIKQGSNLERPHEKHGLNKKVIENMSMHPQLTQMVAFDTFTANRDRNKANVLYDEVRNSFYAIDMACIYDIDHPSRLFITKLACKNIQSMIDSAVEFTRQK